jgi:hypothetical protein
VPLWGDPENTPTPARARRLLVVRKNDVAERAVPDGVRRWQEE